MGTNGARGHEGCCKFVWRKGVLCGDVVYWLTTKGGKNTSQRAAAFHCVLFYGGDVRVPEIQGKHQVTLTFMQEIYANKKTVRV